MRSPRRLLTLVPAVILCAAGAAWAQDDASPNPSPQADAAKREALWQKQQATNAAAAANAVSERVLEAEFEVERLHSRLEMLRARAAELRDIVAKLSQAAKEGDQTVATELQSATLRLQDSQMNIDQTRLELTEAELRVSQLRKVEALRRGPTVSLDFKGGSMQDFVAALRNSVGDRPVNILVTEEGKDQPVPPLKLQAVTMEAALRAAATSAARPGRTAWEMQTLSSGKDGGAAVYRLEFAKNTSVGASGASSQQVQVISITDLISGSGERLSPESLLGAVETGLEMAAADGPARAEMKFHPDSGLLIVRGDDNTLRLVREAVNEMRTDLMRRRGDQMRLKAEAMQRESAIRIAKINLDNARRQHEYQMRRFQQAKQSYEKGAIPQMELLNIEADTARAEAEVAKAEVALQAAEQDAQIQKEAADAGSPPENRSPRSGPGGSMPAGRGNAPNPR
jgi:hypothetical protein